MLNKSAVRHFILDYAKRSRSHGFTRVADSVYDELESKLRKHCRGLVDSQPSAGKTVR